MKTLTLILAISILPILILTPPLAEFIYVRIAKKRFPEGEVPASVETQAFYFGKAAVGIVSLMLLVALYLLQDS